MWFCFILSILEALKACHLGFPGTPGDPNRFPSGEIFPKLQRVASRDPLGIRLRDRDKQLTYVQLLESSRVVFTSDFWTFRTSRSFTTRSSWKNQALEITSRLQQWLVVDETCPKLGETEKQIAIGPQRWDPTFATRWRLHRPIAAFVQKMWWV